MIWTRPHTIPYDGEADTHRARSSSRPRVQFEHHTFVQDGGVVFSTATMAFPFKRQPQTPIEFDACLQIGAVKNQQTEPNAHHIIAARTIHVPAVHLTLRLVDGPPRTEKRWRPARCRPVSRLPGAHQCATRGGADLSRRQGPQVVGRRQRKISDRGDQLGLADTESRSTAPTMDA